MAGNDLSNKKKRSGSKTACPFDGAKRLIHDWALSYYVLFNPGEYFLVQKRAVLEKSKQRRMKGRAG